MASTAPTWRDTSPTLTVLSGLYLVLTALVSFGFGGYIAGRLRSSWDTSLHREFVEFRDGTHGLVAWALAVVISGLVAAVIAATVTSRTLPAAATPTANTGEALIAYDLDRLFRSEGREQGNLQYSRAEASRILLAATSRAGMKPDDRDYLTRLVARQTGIAQPDANRRVEEGIAAAWYAATLGGQHRDQAAPPLRWNLSRA